MKAIILGGVGAVGAEASAALAACGRFDELVVADLDLEKTRRMVKAWGLPARSAVHLDAADPHALERLLEPPFNVIVNALPREFDIPVAEATIARRARAIQLSDMAPALLALHDRARQAQAVYVVGCGATSGLTNMMAKHGSRGMSVIEAVEISFATFRSISLSPASIDGVFWEFGPDVERGYFADQAFHRVALWDGAKSVDFPSPIGRQTVYIAPNAETHTLPRTLGAQRVVVRGTFPPKVMQLMRALVDYGFFAPDPVQINGQLINRRALIREYLRQTPAANQEPIWGYALHVEVIGVQQGRRLKRTLWTTHPLPDQPGWSGPSAWCKFVAYPLVAGALLLAEGNYIGAGVDAPEVFLPTEPFIAELAARSLHVHETVEDL